MGQALAKKLYYSKEEYLEIEAAADYGSEYFQGEIFAMSGGSPRHSRICVNLNRAMWEATRNRDSIGQSRFRNSDFRFMRFWHISCLLRIIKQ